MRLPTHIGESALTRNSILQQLKKTKASDMGRSQENCSFVATTCFSYRKFLFQSLASPGSGWERPV